MPKPPFVEKAEVERFIRQFVFENKKLPTTTEMRSHFGGGSMNRYSDILRDMALPKPRKESPLQLSFDDEKSLIAGIIPFFEKKLASLIEKETQEQNDLRAAAMDELADVKDRCDELKEALAQKDSEYEAKLKEREANFISQVKSVTEKAAFEKVQLQNENMGLNAKIQELEQKNANLSQLAASARKAVEFFKVLEKYAGRKLEENDIEILRTYLSTQEDRGSYFSREFK